MHLSNEKNHDLKSNFLGGEYTVIHSTTTDNGVVTDPVFGQNFDQRDFSPKTLVQMRKNHRQWSSRMVLINPDLRMERLESNCAFSTK